MFATGKGLIFAAALAMPFAQPFAGPGDEAQAVRTRAAVVAARGRILLNDPQLRTALAVSAPLRFGDYVWNEDRIAAGPVRIIVDRQRQLMSVVRAGHEIGTTVIVYGAGAHATPQGRFAIRAKFRDHRSSIYDVDMPFTLRLTDDGVSIHAVAVTRGAVTHGCIGVPPAFAARLFAAAQIGTRVEIL